MRLGHHRPYEAAGRPRVLVPFLGELDPVVLEAAIRIARAEEAVLVPAFLLLLPMEIGPESPLGKGPAGRDAAAGGSRTGSAS